MRSLAVGRWSLRRGLQVLAVTLAALLLMGASDDPRFDKLGHKMMCACGCRQILLECNHVGCSYSDRDRKSTRLNSSHIQKSRMPSSA